MKTCLVTLVIFSFITLCHGQSWKPQQLGISYYGETFTSPGIKLSAHYNLRKWESSEKKHKTKSFEFSPYLGTYYHRNYHTALLIVPEVSYSRTKEKGWYCSYQLGIGYMRTFLPQVYILNDQNEIKKINSGYNHAVIGGAAHFGKRINRNHPITLFAGPRINYAVSSPSNGTLSAIIELGVSIPLNQDKK